jgi:hypothetical protein
MMSTSQSSDIVLDVYLELFNLLATLPAVDLQHTVFNAALLCTSHL